MTNTERVQLIKNALRDYENARRSCNIQKIEYSVNEMENVYIAVCLWGVPGTEKLRQTILSARRECNENE